MRRCVQTFDWQSICGLALAERGRVVVVVHNRMMLCCRWCRVVGGFEALTAMENVESDPKTDKPKVRKHNPHFPHSVHAAIQKSDCCFVRLFTEGDQDSEHQRVCGPVRRSRRSGLSPVLRTDQKVPMTPVASCSCVTLPDH